MCINSVIWKVVRVRQNCWDWKDGERTVRRAKSGETLVEASRDTNAQIVRYTFVMGAKDKSNHLTPGSLSVSVSVCCVLCVVAMVVVEGGGRRRRERLIEPSGG